jgi:DNA-binding CsgD family transcriptional regulator
VPVDNRAGVFMFPDDAHVDVFTFALNRLNHPLLIVDETLRIWFANAAAERLLRADDGVRHRRDRISLASPQAHCRLEKWTRRPASDAHDLTLEVPRRSSDAPLFLSAACARFAGPPAGTRILITLHECEAHDPSRAEARLRQLGLTAAEARVAARAAHALPVVRIATDLTVSKGTVRTQLQAAYRKLGISSRAALARLVSNL